MAKQPTKKDLQTAQAKERICQAVITCLDQVGYAETSINRIQVQAGISRGALTHHFPSKEELIVETMARLLQPILPSAAPRSGRIAALAGKDWSVEDRLLWLWDYVVDTPEGHAMVEILTAARTDQKLQSRISTKFKDWNHEINNFYVELYHSRDGAEEGRVLWSICRVFIRGLIVHKQFEDKERVTELIQRFAEIMTPHLQPNLKARDKGISDD